MFRNKSLKNFMDYILRQKNLRKPISLKKLRTLKSHEFYVY